MTTRPAWPRTIAAARAVQERLRGRVITTDKLGKVRFVAGIDVGFEKAGAITRAAVVALTFPGLELHEQAVARRRTRFPYVPGYLMKARLHKKSHIIFPRGAGGVGGARQAPHPAGINESTPAQK